VLLSGKFGTCTVVSVNGTHVEDKIRRFKGECEHFSFSECPIYTHDGATVQVPNLALTHMGKDNSAVHCTEHVAGHGGHCEKASRQASLRELNSFVQKYTDKK
jgi:hypothetical protein